MKEKPVFGRKKRMSPQERSKEVKRLVENSPAFRSLAFLLDHIQEKRKEESEAIARTYTEMGEFMKGRGRIQAYDGMVFFLEEAMKKSVEA